MVTAVSEMGLAVLARLMWWLALVPALGRREMRRSPRTVASQPGLLRDPPASIFPVADYPYAW